MISLHSHSGQFCSHAKGALEEVVLSAIKKGFKIYGLSEHIPRYREQDLYPEEIHEGVDSLSNKFELYLVEAHRLKALYADQIELLVGIETEFINEEGLQLLLKLLQKHSNPIEYVVGSVHHCHESPIDFDKPTFDKILPPSTSSQADSEKFKNLFETYFDAQYRLMQVIKPEVIGHFDLCRLYYPDIRLDSIPSVWEKVQRNLRFAIGYGALIEINASAFRKGWKTAYPGREVLQLIISLKGRLTISDDSHGPAAVALHYPETLEYISTQNVTELWYLSSKMEAKSSRRVTVVSVKSCTLRNEWISCNTT